MDAGDKAIIKEIAFEAAKVIGDRLEERFIEKIKLHQAECPVKDEVAKNVNQAKGAWKVIAFVSALVGAAISFVASHLWK